VNAPGLMHRQDCLASQLVIPYIVRTETAVKIYIP
jgi:hypothetical protein